nr:hypothetical protein [Gammaproteobacteria bacterium]
MKNMASKSGVNTRAEHSPPLLSIIVATLLILAGVAVLSIAHYNKKLRKHYDNPAVNLFFRF